MIVVPAAFQISSTQGDLNRRQWQERFQKNSGPVYSLTLLSTKIRIFAPTSCASKSLLDEVSTVTR